MAEYALVQTRADIAAAHVLLQPPSAARDPIETAVKAVAHPAGAGASDNRAGLFGFRRLITDEARLSHHCGVVVDRSKRGGYGQALVNGVPAKRSRLDCGASRSRRVAPKKLQRSGALNRLAPSASLPSK